MSPHILRLRWEYCVYFIHTRNREGSWCDRGCRDPWLVVIRLVLRIRTSGAYTIITNHWSQSTYTQSVLAQILSPLQEVPLLGRNPVYMITLFIFAVLQVPLALANNIATILVLRAITGFFASPALATGAASIGDV